MKMKAMVLEEFNSPLAMREVEVSPLEAGEVLLEVKACGLCQTDLKIVAGKIPPPIIELPHIMGHEVAGIVARVGREVEYLREGDRAVAAVFITCGRCEACQRGEENLCDRLKRLGFEAPGGYAQYLKVPARNLVPMDPAIPLEQAAVLPDAVATVYHAICHLGRVKAGDSVLIVGVGGLGVHALQIARLSGARVIAADIKQERLAFALELGADEVVDAGGGNPLEAVKELTGGRGVDRVVEIVGHPETLRWSLPCLRPGGLLILVGYAPGVPFPLDSMAMHYHEWKIMGSRCCTRIELRGVVELVKEGKLRPIVARTYPFEEANEALEQVRKGDIIGRAVLTF